MSAAAPLAAAEVPEPPRDVPWRAVLGAGAGWGVIGAVLLVIGVVRVVGEGGGAVSPFDPDSPARGAIGLLVLPGVVGLVLWWRVAFRRRWLLATGRAAPATVVWQDHVDFPGRYGRRICYRFVDAEGNEHEAKHWAPVGTPTFEIGRGDHKGLVAVHDPRRPERSRLVSAAAFAELLRR